MEIHLTPEQMKAVEGLAAQNGTSPDEQLRRIVEDALQRQQDYDRWFREKVREGRAAAERGEFIEHEEVGRMLDERYRG
jgi:predicted transcriptional regulator